MLVFPKLCTIEYRRHSNSLTHVTFEENFLDSFLTPRPTCTVSARVREHLEEEALHAICVPRGNHSLNLCLQELACTVSIVADTPELVKNTGNNMIRESANRGQLLRPMFGADETVHELMSLYPTRWFVRGAAIQRLREEVQGFAKLSARVKTSIFYPYASKYLRHSCSMSAESGHHSEAKHRLP